MQDPALFWTAHDVLFENMGALWSANRDYLCANSRPWWALIRQPLKRAMDDPDSVAHVLALDEIRQERGIFGQPVFDINGTIYFGAAPYDIFAGVIRAELPDE